MQLLFAEYRLYLSNARWFMREYKVWKDACDKGEPRALKRDNTYLLKHADKWRSKAMVVKDAIKEKTPRKEKRV